MGERSTGLANGNGDLGIGRGDPQDGDAGLGADMRLLGGTDEDGTDSRGGGDGQGLLLEASPLELPGGLCGGGGCGCAGRGGGDGALGGDGGSELDGEGDGRGEVGAVGEDALGAGAARTVGTGERAEEAEGREHDTV